jgi:hypothetical protein
MKALACQPAAQAVAALSPVVPAELARRLLFLPDRSRSMGIHVMAGKGSGKSRLLGRMIVWQDFIRRVPLVVLDPHGPTIDNFLDQLTRLPAAYQERLWPRVLYVDLAGGDGFVVPFPLHYSLGGESLYQVSQRYLDVVRKSDPYLQTASVEGFNALWRIGTYAGMILAALGYQITEAEHLVSHPEAWSDRFQQVLHSHPEVAPAVRFFRDQYGEWKEEARARRSDSFLTKVALFTMDPTMRAMFGADKPGIDWQRVLTDRLAVLLDFRREFDLERRRFKMLWTFGYLLDFVKHRGAGRHLPISLVIDELTSLLGVRTMNESVIATELDELINVIARNYSLWLTIAHQELFQMDEHSRKALMGMGTQILGVTSDPEAALYLARQFFRYDPHLVRKTEPVYMGHERGEPKVIDYRTIEFTVEEQAILNSHLFQDQRRFHFLVRPAPAEGDITGPLVPVTLEHFDSDRYVNEELVAQARKILMRKHGRQVTDVLGEIQQRLQRPPLIRSRPSRTIERNERRIHAISDSEPDDSFREAKKPQTRPS